MRNGPLAGVRVLDLSRILAGPWCTQILGDLGAEVIKIEQPRRGDDTRDWGPPFVHDADGGRGDAAYFLAANRNKRSVALDIATPHGRRAVREIAAISDVLVENFKVGNLARFGLDYQSLQGVNPRLVYCSITGFGQTGPYRERAGYDFIIQAMGGLMSVTGERDDRPGSRPQKVGVAVADLAAGLYATIGILAALAHARATGKGQRVDLALLDTQVALLANLNQNYLSGGQRPRRMGNAHQNICPYQTFAAADGEIVIAVGNDSQFERLCQVAGHGELAADPRFRRNSDRVVNRETLVPLLAEIVHAKPSRFWLDGLEAAGVPVGPINSIDQVWADRHVLARDMRIEVAHPRTAKLPLVGSPLKLSRTPVTYRAAPPELGADTRSVLTSLLGWNDDDVEACLADTSKLPSDHRRPSA